MSCLVYVECNTRAKAMHYILYRCVGWDGQARKGAQKKKRFRRLVERRYIASRWRASRRYERTPADRPRPRYIAPSAVRPGPCSVLATMGLPIYSVAASSPGLFNTLPRKRAQSEQENAKRKRPWLLVDLAIQNQRSPKT